MHEHGLAKELWPQLQGIAEINGLARVRRIDMIVGMLHGVSAELLAHSFEHAFEGTNFAGTKMEIAVVEPGQEYACPGASEPSTANGWELLIIRIEGD